MSEGSAPRSSPALVPSGDDELPVIGEPLPLELVNTAHTWDGEVVESLGTPDALRTWTAAVLSAEDLVVGRRDLVAVHRLRAAVTDLVTSLRAGTPPSLEAIDVVNADLGLTAPGRRLVRLDARLAVSRPDPPTSVTELRGAIATATLELVSSASPARLRGCANPPCGMVFLATHGRRRFCTSWCSDDDRQRRFRRRHAGS